MPTLPPGDRPDSPADTHKARQMAESFGVDAARYDRTRPRYPDAMVQRIMAASPGRSVLDVGCGTGIAARQFQAAGCTVLGVEPDSRMADFAGRRGLEVEVGTFENWKPAGRTFDAVVAGQTWHWVDPVAGAAQAARALRPGGRLAVFWNADEPPAELTDALATVYRRLMPGFPATGMPSPVDAYSSMCDKAAEGIDTAGGFTAPERWTFDADCHYTCAEYLDMMPTQGLFTRLPAPVLAEILAEVGAAIDELGGGFTLRRRTVVVTATRA
ncbi:class I SAM-dependent methyltransferase [Nocardia huaxiensis]|uniref:Class I SAM-dependent methyltransferase n=1 Tax=Nocardia huaxiensis TaxID=2755382 RepID=A0A7D6VI38_9NOCA|nr:class I SAM-dependent methyltransferase [Nocardia huaxiensis]QLY30130.1 class I SAM-dependent methyltransferase [Nocardia huaxiensis]